jgi:membrane protein
MDAAESSVVNPPPKVAGNGATRVSIRRLLAETMREWQDDNIMRHSAGLAYYAIFALAPLLVIVLSLAATTFGEEAVRGQLYDELAGLMGPRAAAIVQDMVAKTMQPQKSFFATAFGVGMLIFAATNLFAEMQHSLNVIWGKERQSDTGPILRNGILMWLRTRLLSLGMVLVILFLLLVSLILTGVLSYVSAHLSLISDLPFPLWGWMGFLISLFCEVILFALLFKVLPDVRFPWRHVWWGAGVTAILFEVGKWSLGWYLSSDLLPPGLEAAGSIMLLLLWVYYTSIIILTGAELTHVRSRLSGDHPLIPVTKKARTPPA